MTLSLRQALFIISFTAITFITLLVIIGSYLLLKVEMNSSFNQWLGNTTSLGKQKDPTLPSQQEMATESFSYFLTNRFIRDSFLTLLITFPFLAVFSWLITSLVLRSLTRVTKAIIQREPHDFEPLDMHAVPKEIKPLVNAVNDLLQKLQQHLEQEKRFSADAAHELRTPLAALKVHSEIALAAQDEITRTNALKKILSCVNRSTHLIEQLLTLNRVLNGTETDLQLKPLRLPEVAVDVISLLIPDALRKNIEVTLDYEDKNTTIMGNLGLTCILIRNLVDNAIRYTQASGQIVVTIKETADAVIFRVTDNGPGIQPELMAHVFERFYRVLGSQSSGSGLGLAITKQIVDILQADIELSSPEKGSGLVVTITFPIKEKGNRG